MIWMRLSANINSMGILFGWKKVNIKIMRNYPLCQSASIISLLRVHLAIGGHG